MPAGDSDKSSVIAALTQHTSINPMPCHHITPTMLVYLLLTHTYVGVTTGPHVRRHEEVSISTSHSCILSDLLILSDSGCRRPE